MIDAAATRRVPRRMQGLSHLQGNNNIRFSIIQIAGSRSTRASDSIDYSLKNILFSGILS